MKHNQLIETVSQLEEIIVVMHDNPDPDAIASAWCIVELLKHKGIHSVRAVAGGSIMRAENLLMVELLKPPIQLVGQLDHSWLDRGGNRKSAAILVDCGAGATNHLVTYSNLPLVGVIDHHQNPGGTGNQIPFVDIRLDAAACASITSSYLIGEGIEPSEELATAIWYALRTETCAYESSYSQLDRDVLLWVTSFGSPALLAEIENAPLSRQYFSDLKHAIDSTRLWNDTALCWLADAQGVEVVGEVADLIVRCVDVNQALCGTIVNGDAYVSVRTSPQGGNATELLMATIREFGNGGGHAHRAGGKIEDIRQRFKDHDSFANRLQARWLESNGITSDVADVSLTQQN